MNILKQVCTYNQAVSLLAAGIEHHTTWYWMKKKTGAIGLCIRDHLKELQHEAEAVYPAYSVAELLEVMGDHVAVFKEKGNYSCSVHKSNYAVPDIKGGFEFFIVKSDKSAAEAVAAMFIILRKYGLI